MSEDDAWTGRMVAIMESARAVASEREKDPKWQEAMRLDLVKRARQNAEWPFRASGLAKYLHPDDLHALAYSKTHETPATAIVDEWVRQYDPAWRGPKWRRMLWVNGPCGLGKTMAAGRAIEKICPWRETEGNLGAARYITFRSLMDLTRAMRSNRGQDAAEARDRFETVTTAPLVVLDEIGQELEADKDIARIALHDFVDLFARGHGLALMMSNKSSADIRARFTSDWYDSRTESRLKKLLTRAADGVGLHDLKGDDLRGGAI